MRAGKLRHFVSVQRPENVETEDGSREQTWIEERAVYADIRPMTGRQLAAMQQIQSEVTVTIVIRGSYVPQADRRIVFGSKIYDIKATLNIDERSREVHLLCGEGLNDG